MILASVVSAAADRLRSAGISRDETRGDAVVLARAVLGWSAAEWLSHSIDQAPPGFEARFDALIARRAAREPVAYILGEREFYGRSFRVTRDVLIPRPETELVVDEALMLLLTRMTGRRPVVVDVGTGSGCIAVTLALEVPGAHVIGTDGSAAALRIARDNGARLGASDRVEWRTADLLVGVRHPVDLIVSNPPYVPQGDRQSLQPEVRDFEPDAALFGGPDGLTIVRRLVGEAAQTLGPAGAIAIEIGLGQADAVRALLETAGFIHVRVRPDLQGIPRVAVAERPALSL